MRQHTMTLCSCLLLLILTLHSPSMAMDTITPAMPIKDGQTLVSSGGTFQLGFFSPSNSSNRYVGIWYKSIPDQIVVWVANRASPLGDLTGVLSIDSNGSLVLSDGASVIQWSSSSVNATSPVAQLLDSGNFVLKASSDPETFEWESFNDPRDTLLPGMKLGWNSRTGIDCYLTAWKRPDDPSPGDCSFRLEVRELPELYQYNGSQRIYAGWNGLQFGGVPELKSSDILTFSFFSGQDEAYYSFVTNNSSITSRFVVSELGQVQHYIWIDMNQDWSLFWQDPKDQCNNYMECGSCGIYDSNGSPICSCMKG